MLTGVLVCASATTGIAYARSTPHAKTRVIQSRHVIEPKSTAKPSATSTKPKSVPAPITPVRAAATTAPAAATPTPSATPAYTFDDEFSGAAGTAPNGAIWTPETGGGGWGNNELEYYTARTRNASLDGDGHLAIRAYQETYTGYNGVTESYTSARLISKQSILYGTISARIELPSGQGLWPAFWTLGADMASVDWPTCGEIDIMEALNTMPTDYGTVHGPNGVSTWSAYGLGGTTSPAGGLANAWHVFSVQWAPTSVTWLLDGQPFRTISKSDLPANDAWEFSKPHQLLLNMAVGGWPGNPAASTFSNGPATMLVDWVRVLPA